MRINLHLLLPLLKKTQNNPQNVSSLSQSSLDRLGDDLCGKGKRKEKEKLSPWNNAVFPKQQDVLREVFGRMIHRRCAASALLRNTASKYSGVDTEKLQRGSTFPSLFLSFKKNLFCCCQASAIFRCDGCSFSFFPLLSLFPTARRGAKEQQPTWVAADMGTSGWQPHLPPPLATLHMMNDGVLN